MTTFTGKKVKLTSGLEQLHSFQARRVKVISITDRNTIE